MKTISYLPTKIKYNSKKKVIDLYYRKKESIELHKYSIPFKHYIYIEPRYLEDNNINTSLITHGYRLLTNNAPLAKVHMLPYESREIFKNNMYTTGEGDLSPEQRFMCDSYYDTEFPTDIQPRLFYIDIETYTKDGLLPRFNHNISEINAITLYDNYTQIFYSWFLTPPSNTKTDFELRKEILEHEIIKNTWQMEKDKFVINFFSSPKKLLSSFMDFLSVNVPDIITAWNAPFDIPYIVRKVYDHFDNEGVRRLSPFREISYEVTNALEYDKELDKTNIIPGIDVIDMLELYKKNKFGEQQSYALKYIGTMELGESKIVSESGSSDLTYRFEEEYINFCIYNIQDVRLLTLLEDKLKILNLAMVIRNITKVNYQDIFFETITLDNYFIMEANKRREKGDNIVLPTKPLTAVKQPYIGAYVKPTLVGRYKWIADLKYNIEALYSNI